MALKTLALYCYNLAQNAVVDYSALAEDLTFTSNSPGGYGDLHCTIKVQNARLLAQHPELALFARVAVMDGPTAVWLGRIDEPAIVLDSSNGDEVELHAMGLADALKDDPNDYTYQGSTAQAVLIDQLTGTTYGRNVTLTGTSGWLDSDTSLVLPTNPSGTYFEAYPAYTMEQILNDLLGSIGDYTYTVFAHPSANLASGAHVDTLGFPKGVLAVHARDLSTVSYTGYLADEDSHDIRPSVEYAFNAVRLKYRDATTQQPASVTVADSRLSLATFGGQYIPAGQGTAPFAWRCFAKDLTNLTLSSTQATAVANAILNDNLNGGSKIQVKLARVCDANGKSIPLWQVRADANIFLPELAPLAQQLPTAPTAYNAVQGGNVFYITETEYSESSGQTPLLTVTCNSFSDKSTFQFNRLQLQAEAKLRAVKVPVVVAATGAAETGTCGVQWGGTALAADLYGASVNFKTVLSSAPSSVTLTNTTILNANTPGAQNVSAFGFLFNVKVTANGPGFWFGSYKTVGN